jgi:Rrf2 family nitric oxide-sensitive transcriptional repressor
MFKELAMHLALQTDFALRTLTYLASTSERATIRQVAEFYRISIDHVAKVVLHLNRLGYIRSVRGVGGGIELGRPAVDIRVGEVIAAFEGSIHLLECVGREGVCVVEGFCKLKRVLAEAERVQMEFLNSVTLKDVLPTRPQLRSVAPNANL